MAVCCVLIALSALSVPNKTVMSFKCVAAQVRMLHVYCETRSFLQPFSAFCIDDMLFACSLTSRLFFSLSILSLKICSAEMMRNFRERTEAFRSCMKGRGRTGIMWWRNTGWEMPQAYACHAKYHHPSNSASTLYRLQQTHAMSFSKKSCVSFTHLLRCTHVFS